MEPIPADHPIKQIPAILKTHNGMFHALARSDDPAIKCQNISNLIGNLKTTMLYAGLLEYPINPGLRDPSMKRFLDYQMLGANKAWNLYTRGNPGYAVEIANTVLGEVTFLIYDKRFTTEDTNALFNKDKGTVKPQ